MTKEDRRYNEALHAKLALQRPDLIKVGEDIMKRADYDFIQLEKNGESEAYNANWQEINKLLGEIELSEDELNEIKGR